MPTQVEALRILARTAILADLEIVAIVGDRVYDDPPANPATPWVRIGETFSMREDATCVDVAYTDLTIHVWSVIGGKAANSALCDRIGRALHETSLSDFPAIDPSGEIVVELEHRSNQTFTDQDGRTQHGVVTVRAITEN